MNIQRSFFPTLSILLILCSSITIPLPVIGPITSNPSRTVDLLDEWITILEENQPTTLLGMSIGPAKSFYMVLGKRESIYDYPRIYASYFRGNGSIIWEKELNFSNPWARFGTGSSHVATSNRTGALYIAGSIQNDTWNEDAILTRVEPNGSQSWEYRWEKNEREHFEAVTIDPADNIIAAGSTDSFDSLGENGLLVQFSPEGSQIWNYTWNGADSAWATEFQFVKAERAGEVYAVGKMRQSRFGGYKEGILAAKFTSNGQLLWNATWLPFMQNSTRRFVSVHGCVVREAGGLLILGTLRSDINIPLIYFCLVLDDDGSWNNLQSWEAKRSTEEWNESIQVNDLTSFEELNYISVGTLSRMIYQQSGIQINQSVYILILDNNGKKISSRVWTRFQILSGEKIIREGVHSYYITGRIYSDSFQGANGRFIAKARIEVSEPSSNKNFAIFFILGSLFIISIVAIVIVGLSFFAQMRQGKKKDKFLC